VKWGFFMKTKLMAIVVVIIVLLYLIYDDQKIATHIDMIKPNQSGPVERVDYWEPSVRSFALSAISPKHEGTYNINQVFDIWDEIMARWVYVSDPNGSKYAETYHFTAASETIALFDFRGDCDDFAVLLAACIHAIGGTTRIMVENDRSINQGHAYTLVYIGKDHAGVTDYIAERYTLNGGDIVSYLKDDYGWWLNLDWQANHPGGPIWAADEYRQVLLEIMP
jgi:hypothetical protein